jgi:hypothetical protein
MNYPPEVPFHYSTVRKLLRHPGGHMTKAGTEILFTALLFLSTPFVCLSTDQIRLEQSWWILQRKTERPVNVTDIAVCQDPDNIPIVVSPSRYETDTPMTKNIRLCMQSILNSTNRRSIWLPLSKFQMF